MFVYSTFTQSEHHLALQYVLRFVLLDDFNYAWHTNGFIHQRRTGRTVFLSN